MSETVRRRWKSSGERGRLLGERSNKELLMSRLC